MQELALIEGKKPGTINWGKEASENDGWLHTEKNGSVIREQVPSLQGNYGDYYEGIYQTLRHGAPLPVTAEEGKNVIRVIEAAFLSDRDKKQISL